MSVVFFRLYMTMGKFFSLHSWYDHSETNMSQENIFLKPVDFYQRQVDPIAQSIQQQAFYLSKMTGDSIEECRKFIVDGIKAKQFQGLRDPVVEYFERDDNGDKQVARCSLSRYLNEVKKNKEVLVPTLTSYVNSNEKQSPLVGFIDTKTAARSVVKKEAAKAKADGNKLVSILKENEQENIKRNNNSMSGSFASQGSVLHNPTGHNTLTSIIRTVSSLGNSSNEKIIAGNRHYYNSDVTLNNLISITSSLDKDSLRAVIDKYGLVYPSVDDVVRCVRYSSDLYWIDDRAFSKIYDFIVRLDEVERAGFMYIGDLYHIRKMNELFIRQLLTKLSQKITTVAVENPIDVIYKADEQLVCFAHQVCYQEMRGKGKDYSKLPENDLHTLAATVINIGKTIESYKDLIDAFFLTINVPASTAYIPNMVRRAVVLSDTDSTMFSVDEYVSWYFGKLIFSDEAFALAASVMFIATQCISHTLAIFSANMNVDREKLFKLAMKPEFSFPVFAQTSVAKHYYTCITVREGNIYQEMEMEIKGVHLKNSAAPKALINKAHAKMKEILTKVMNNEKISIIEELIETANEERLIAESLLRGEIEYFKQSKIKPAEAYSKSPEQSPYLYHIFWQEVFEPKYGSVGMPTYGVIKVPTIVENITGVKNWLDNIKDRELAERLGAWLAKHKKTSLPTIYLSNQYVKSYGIPEEIIAVLDIKKVQLDLTIVRRIVLESLGYFPKPNLLISELGY